jgi:hypothetical protein
MKTETKIIQEATILEDASESNVIDLKNNFTSLYTISGIITPDNLRGVASLTILHSDSANGVFTPYKDSSNNAWSITLATSSTHSINPLNVSGLLQFIKLKGDDDATGDDLVIKVLGTK